MGECREKGGSNRTIMITFSYWIGWHFRFCIFVTQFGPRWRLHVHSAALRYEIASIFDFLWFRFNNAIEMFDLVCRCVIDESESIFVLFLTFALWAMNEIANHNKHIPEVSFSFHFEGNAHFVHIEWYVEIQSFECDLEMNEWIALLVALQTENDEICNTNKREEEKEEREVRIQILESYEWVKKMQ